MRERLRLRDVARDAAAGDGAEARRLTRWRHLAAKDDAAAFARRLAWDGIGEGAAELLRAVVPNETDPLPGWTQTLDAAASAAIAGAPDAAHPWLLSDAPLPFEALLAPFVSTARARLLAEEPRYATRLSPRAQATLERALLVRLAQLAFRTLNLELSVSRVRQPTAGGHLHGAMGAFTVPGTDRAYASFVRRHLADGYHTLFDEYPVLARLAATLVDHWVEAGAEFVSRLDADLPVLRSAFGDAAIDRVQDLRVLISDPHHHGRGVIGVLFETGLKVIYKPRDLGPEAAFGDLLSWCNEAGLSLPLRTLRVVRRDGYGWMEFAEAARCTAADDVHRFYVRAGMLLALVHAMGGTDFHLENIVACSEQPVLVDLETLLSPRLHEMETAVPFTGALKVAADRMRDSVMATQFLPSGMAVIGDESADISGLGAITGREVEGRALEHVNTDGMRTVRRRMAVPAGANSPFADASAGVPQAYVEDVVTGFREAIALMATRGHEWLSRWRTAGGPQSASFRIVLRSTWVYGSLLARTTDPRFLRDGADRGIELEALARAWTSHAERPAMWPVLDAELAALESMDVPFFTFRADRTVLESAGSPPIAGAFSERPWDTLVRRWETLGEGIDGQVRAIRSAWLGQSAAAQPASGRDAQADAEDTPSATRDVRGATSSTDRLLDEAVRLGRLLAARAIVGGDGSVAWLGLQFDPKDHRGSYQPLDQGLYGGVAGILLFLAALERCTGMGEFDDMVRGAVLSWRALLSSLRADLDPPSAQAASDPALGMAQGVGSTIYSLATLGAWWGDRDCFDAALSTAALVTPDRIAADRRLDVFGGASGAILALLKLHHASGSAEALARAAACGTHLLRASTGGSGNRAAWGESIARPGFAYGGAGIAYALSRLAQATGDDAFRIAAIDAFTMPRVAAGSGWCDGAAGELVALAGAMAEHHAPQLGRDCENALDATLAADLSGPDALCCGNLGRVAALVTASQCLARPDLLDAARAHAATAAGRAASAGGYRYFAWPHAEVDNPGLFPGDAGIGYALLRAIHPADLPCILAFG